MHLSDYIKENILNPPQVDANLCVHTKTPLASCRHCLDACPHEAWLLDDHALSINLLACDGCGLCLPACPEDALAIPEQEEVTLVGVFKGVSIAFLSCKHVQTTTTMPCVHSVGWKDLLGLYHKGIKALMVSTEECSQCEHQSNQSLWQQHEYTNQLLQSCDLPPLKLIKKPATQWQQWFNTLTQNVLETNSRRDFLKNMAQKAADVGLEHVSAQKEARTARVLSEILPAETYSIYPAIPVIDSTQCNTCGVCVRLCPHHSITADNTHYHIHPEHCTGCAICQDVCDQGAITIHTWHTAFPLEKLGFALEQHRCSRCGVDFSVPAPKHEDTQNNNYCAICTKTTAHQNLFQTIS